MWDLTKRYWRRFNLHTLHLLLAGAVVGATVIAGLLAQSDATPAAAQSDTPAFRLPFAEPPGPDTWFVSQAYGASIWAQRNWPELYAAGQGIHFGIDFATRCGREVRAIGDGTVLGIDGNYGSPPHNLAIQHSGGYVSIYGHLRERTTLVRVGQQVKAGDVVAHSGDPYSVNCDKAPHLHLEIRTNGVSRTTNPMLLIPADWDRLTLGVGGGGTSFAQDLTDPRRWGNLRDQPDITFGGGILVNYPTWQPYA